MTSIILFVIFSNSIRDIILIRSSARLYSIIRRQDVGWTFVQYIIKLIRFSVLAYIFTRATVDMDMDMIQQRTITRTCICP